MNEHYNLVCSAFELTRSAFNYKPSWSHLDSLSDEVLEAEITFLSKVVKQQMEEERAEELAHEQAVIAAMTVKSGFTIGELIGA